MARLVLGVAGAAVGSLFGMPQLGFVVGSMLGGAFEPNIKQQGPRLSDLKAPAASYGAPIFYVEGHPRIAGVWAWCSDKRELAHTAHQGKGGPGVDSTTYTYEMDVLIVLTEGEFAGVRRVWDSGKLIWTAADDADADSLAASAATTAWRELRVLTGAATQLPDPTYEAAFGVGNVPAMRDRGCIVIEGLNLGSSGQPPVLTFEVGDGVSQPGEVVSLWDFEASASLGPADYPSGYPTTATRTVNDRSSLATPNEWTIEGHERTTVTMGGGSLYIEDYQASGSFSNAVLWTPASARFAADGDVTIEVRLNADGNGWVGTSSRMLLASCMSGAAISNAGEWSLSAMSNVITMAVDTGGGAVVVSSLATDWPGGSVDFELAVARKSGIWRMFVDGRLVGTQAAPANNQTLSSTGILTIAGRQQGLHYIPNDYAPATYKGFRFTVGVALYDADYTPSRPWTLSAMAGTVTLVDAPLDQVVLRQCQRGGLLSSQVDVTALAGKSVRAMAVSQVTSPRTVIENLMAAYLFEAVEGDKLKFVLRGGAPVATIAYDDMGVAADGSETPEPLPITRANDTEIPQQVTVKYCNTDDDYQDGAETSDRLLIGGAGVRVVEVPLGLTPTEAKQLANVIVMDAAASMLRVGPVALTRAHTALEPTDVVMLTDHDGSTFRSRLQKRTDAQGVITFDGVVEDATVLSSSVATSGGYSSSATVKSVADTVLELLDIPILRDVDNSPGIYAAVKGAGTPWSGAALFRSLDDVTYSKEIDTYAASVIGTCTTALGDYSGGNVFDRGSSVTVNVGAGTLSSSTHDLLIAGPTNAALIGDEIVQFQNATLVSAGVYTLTVLLRGRRGTEWASTGHAASERFVLLDSAALRRMADELAYLDAPWYWRAVSFRKSLATATAETFTDTGVALKPFAPVDLRTSTASDGAITLTWRRRSRLSSRFLATTGTPLGEAGESYAVDVIDQADSSVKRTLTASVPSVTYSAADQATDGTFDIRFAAYQISAIVGRGYPATLNL